MFLLFLPDVHLLFCLERLRNQIDTTSDYTTLQSVPFPFSIEKWEETYVSGFGQGAKTLTTTAIKMKQLQSTYWSQNKNADVVLRDTLGLKD